MIYVWLSWGYLALIFFTVGHLFETLLKKFFGFNNESFDLPGYFKIPLGISFVVLLLPIIHFTVSISHFLHISFIVTLAIYSALFGMRSIRRAEFSWPELFSKLRFNLPFLLTFLALSLVLSYSATDYPFSNRDNGRYHFQAVLWAKEYPIVPGLANLHDRLGYNSAWYLVNAFFDHFWLNRKGFHVVNSFLIFYLFTISLYFIFRRNKEHAGNLLQAAGLLLFLFLSFNFYFIFTWLLVGVTPETSVHFFVICFLLLLLYFYEGKVLTNSPEIASSILIVMICSAFASRMSGIFMSLSAVLLLAFLILNKKMTVQYAFRLSVLVMLFCLPIFIRNLILSGYLLFPSQAFDVFDFDWKVPKQMAAACVDWIANHAIYNFAEDTTPFSGLMDTRRLSMILGMLKSELSQVGVLFFTAFSVVCLFSYSFFTRLQKSKSEWLLILFGVVFVMQFLLCYVSGPIVRFGFGYIAILFILPLVLILAQILQTFSQNAFLRWGITFSFLVIILIKLYVPTLPVSPRETRLAYPITVVMEFFNATTYLPELVRGKQKSIVINKQLMVHVSDYDNEHLKLSRIRLGPVYRDPACGKVDFLAIDKTSHRSCEAYNAVVATMTWMDPLPTVGAIYQGLTLRGSDLRNGFKIVPQSESSRRYSSQTLSNH